MFTTDILETYEASDVFDAVCATDVGTNLTKSHLLLQACEQTGVSVEESILVGDSTIEAKGAEEIGMDFLAVLYGWGFRTKEETEEYKCVGTVSSPAEISQKVMALWLRLVRVKQCINRIKIVNFPKTNRAVITIAWFFYANLILYNNNDTTIYFCL